jgi:hypothetical protein
MPDTFEPQPQLNLSGSAPAVINEIPQFAKAEYAHPPRIEHCRICSNLISGDYYLVNNLMACAACAEQAQSGQPRDSHSAFARGLLVGSLGAIAGLILYATVAIVTGWTIGYVALGVGWLVGKGITKGSSGLGGRRYQVAAVLLTYCAISMAAIPIAIAYSIKHRPATAQNSALQTTAPNAASPQSPAEPKPKRPVHLGAALGGLLFLGLASPFLEFTGNFGGAAIGLFILFIGLRIAWAITTAKPLSVDGPFSPSAP